jgi:hypothetical protein
MLAKLGKAGEGMLGCGWVWWVWGYDVCLRRVKATVDEFFAI